MFLSFIDFFLKQHQIEISYGQSRRYTALLFPKRTPFLVTEDMLLTQTIIMHTGRTFRTLGIHHNTQCGRKETRFARKIDGTTILIDEVSEMDTFTMMIPGNTRKFYRAFLRHREKMRRKRKLTFGSTGLDDLYILWGQRS
jgi:hypothetical protein